MKLLLLHTLLVCAFGFWGRRRRTRVIPKNTGRYQVLSDWDDTLAAAGGSSRDSFKYQFVGRVAGSDRSLLHGTVYPGVEELYKTLSPVVNIVSANPTSSQIVKKQGILDKWWKKYHGNSKSLKIGKLFKGSYLDGLSFSRMANTKFEHLRDFSKSGKSRVFFGDNGQGDVVAAYKAIQAGVLDYGMMHITNHDPRLKLSDDGHWNLGSYNIRPKTHLRQGRHGIYMFMNYNQAAYIAFALGLINAQSFNKIVAAYKNDFAKLSPADQKGYLAGPNCIRPTGALLAAIPSGLAEKDMTVMGCNMAVKKASTFEAELSSLLSKFGQAEPEGMKEFHEVELAQAEE